MNDMSSVALTWLGGRIMQALGRQWIARTVMILCLSGMLHGQGSLSTIRGTITDRTGAVVAGATVTVTEVKTNVRIRTVTTDSNGNYEVPEVQPGVYRVKVEMPGFKIYVAENTILEGAQIRRVDIVLELGALIEQVTVQAGASPITTDSAEISSQFKAVLYEQTPMVLNYYPHSLIVTLPGVESEGSGWNLRINGQPASQVALGMDGVTNDGTVNLVNKMDFSDLTVTGVNNTADQARVANYNMISKRGDNSFHGEAFYTHFNSALNARQFFDPVKPAEKEHRGEIQVSGPVIKNRTFFFVSYFYLKLPAGSFHRTSVPTLKMRQGDFSQFSTSVKDPLTGAPFPNNVIPANRFNPTSAKIQESFIPQANLGTPDTLVSNFGFLHPFPSDLFEARYPQFRIDHNITQNNSLFVRWVRRRTPYVLTSELPQFNWTRFRSHTASVVSDTHVFSPKLVNAFRFGLKTDYVEDGIQEGGVTPVKADQVIQQMGIQGVNRNNYKTEGAPYITMTGLASVGMAVGGGVNQDEKLYSYADSVTYSTGRHVWKFGGEYKRDVPFNGYIPYLNNGQFDFNGSLTNQVYGDFLLGLPFSSQRLDPFTNRTQAGGEFGIYTMDTFKVTSKLTLDYGLRWDYFPAAHYEDGRQYAFDPKTGNIVVSQDALAAVSPLYPKTIHVVAGKVLPDPQLTNFRPRLGVAYRLQDRAVIRGGYGIFTEEIGYFSRLQGGGPFQIAETYFNKIQNGQPLFAFPNPFPDNLAQATVPSQSISAYPMQTSNGAIHQFNVSLERQIWDLGLRLSYIGSRSRGLNYSMNINKPQPSLIPFSADRRPFPQFVNVAFAQNNGASNYNSFQFEVQRKVGAFTFDGHYTLQSNTSNFLDLENPYNPNQSNREAYSARHHFVVSTIIDLPWGKGRRFLSHPPAVVDGVLGGWRIITVSIFQSGQFFTPSYSGSDPSNTNSFGGIPDRICDGNLPSGQRSIQRWFDPSCFAVPPAGRFGNSGVNILQRPGLNVHNMSLVKTIDLNERFKLEYVAGFSNLFNHPMFAPPLSNISAPRAGQITSILVGADLSMEETRARLIEMTLRVRW